MIEKILLIYLLVTLFFFFYRIKTGVLMYLCYFLLIPVINVYVGSFGLQRNMVNLVLLIAFFVRKKNLQLDAEIFYPFILLFFLQLLEIPFQTAIPTDVQLNAWRQDCMSSVIFPLVLWNVAKKDAFFTNLTEKIFLICIFVAVAYGLFLTLMPGLNPYMQVMLPVMGGEFNEAYAAGNSGVSVNTTLNSTRMFGRISSVFTHPMAYGLFLSFSIVYCYMKTVLEKNKLFLFLLILTIAATFVCGIRTPIAALFIGVVFYLVYTHRVKTAVQVGVVAVCGFVIVNSIPVLSDFIYSIIDSKGGDVQGSSFSMRVKQLMYCFDVLGNDYLFGKGYSWTTFYMTGGRVHPLLLAFESLAFVVLCNNGFAGVCFWCIAAFVLYRITSKKIGYSRHRIFIWLIALMYFSYSMITGEYGYMKYLILFYTMIYLQINKRECE